jgi:hypothetical protein
MPEMAISEPADARINEQLMEAHEVADVTMICICALQRDEVEPDLECCAFGDKKPLCSEARAHRFDTCLR